MKLADSIPTGKFDQAPSEYEQLYRIHYHLGDLGGGFGAVYVRQQTASEVYVRIDEVTGALERLFFAPSMAKWLVQEFGAYVWIDWAHTKAPELEDHADEPPPQPAGLLEDSTAQRKAGARRLRCNVWARNEYAKGRSIDDLLPEYINRYTEERGTEPAEPRDTLRKALQN